MSTGLNGATKPDPDAELKDGLERAMQHLDAQRWGEADSVLESLQNEFGERPALVHYRGMVAFGRGDRESGIEMTERALHQLPDDPVILCDYGSQLANSGRLDDAILQFQSAADAAPNYAIAQGNLGAALVLKKDFEKAIPRLKRAIELDGRLLDAHTNLAVAYMDTNYFDLAVDILFKALALNPLDPQIHTRLSAALYRRERHDTAEYHARRAIELAPKAGEPYLHLGNALASAGQMDEAAEALMTAAQRPPVGLAALSRLIHLRKTTEDGPEFEILQRFLQNADKLAQEGQSNLYFAAGKAYDDLKDYPRAFEFFFKANEINKEVHPFNAENYLEQSNTLVDFVSPELVERCGGGGLDSVAPIFICGMPRSGTTLTEQMFSRHAKVQAGGEMAAAVSALRRNDRLKAALNDELPNADVSADDFKRLGEDYVAAVRAEGIKSEVFTDKMPANYRHIGLLALALPRAKFLIMRRHPLDCLLSNYFQSFGRNQPFSSDFTHMAMVYGAYDAHAKHWASLFPKRAREVAYEAIVDDAEAVMRSALAFTGLDWSDAVLDHKASSHQVNTASISQVREPIYRRAVARWERYRDEVAPLIDALKTHAPDVSI